MEKTNIRRLIGVMMPFMIMVIVQRLGILLFGMGTLPSVIGDTLAFLAASAAGIFFFRMSCGAQALRPGSVPDAGTSEEDDRPVPPFPQRDTVFGRLMYMLIGTGVLIVTMYVVTAAADTEVVSASPAAFPAAEFVSLVLIHPILEEYVFRWLYYRELRPMQPIFAGLAQAVMFAIVHGSVGGMIYALFAGGVLVFVTEFSGSLTAAVGAHMLVNLRSLVYMTWLTDAAFANAAQIRMILDFGVVSIGFGAVLILMVRRGLREVWAARKEDETEENTDDGE